MFLFFLGEYPGAEWLFVRYMLSFFLKWILSGYLFGWSISGWLLRCVSLFFGCTIVYLFTGCVAGAYGILVAAAAKSASVVSDSVWPHRRQPTRLPCPWDSPGKNTGVGCHFLLQCMKVKSESEVTEACPTLLDPTDCSLPGSSVHGVFQARVLEWGAIAYPRIFLPLPEIEPAPRCSGSMES